MIDLLDPQLHASGEVMAVFRRLRAESPVAWCEGRRGPGYWAITGHPELVAAARDTGAFSSSSGTRPEVVRPQSATRPLHNMDPPAHSGLRAVANAALGDLDALEPEIAAIVGAELDALGAGGDATRCGEAIAGRVIAAWLQLEESPQEILGRVADVHAAGAALIDTSRDDAAWPARVETARQASEAIARLVAYELDVGRVQGRLALGGISRDPAIGLVTLFLEAGIPTLIDSIACALVDLAEQPQDIEDIPLLAEELLRRASPVAQFARRATREVELGGQQIRAGQQVVLWFASANHDERVFADPEALVATRAPNPHVAFGVGPHRCVGAGLGRRVLRALLAELRGSAIVLAGRPVRRASSYLRGYQRAEIVVSRRI